MKLKKSEAALIFNEKTGEFSLVLPTHNGEDEVPEGVLLLSRLFVKANADPGWVTKMADEFKAGADEPETDDRILN